MAAMAIAVTTMMGTVVGAAPAQAAASDCPANYFCLFHWVNYQGGRWQINPTTAVKDSCWNFSNSKYTTGYVVNNSSASIVNKASTNYTIYFYDWVNCNNDGAVTAYVLSDDFTVAHLDDWYHRFTSFSIA
jgi:hypothetical protein